MTSRSGIQLNPNVSVDCVIFGFDFEELKVLLIERKHQADPSGNVPATDMVLPGDLIYDNETLDDAAGRVLKELSGLSNIYLEQFKSFGSPDRVKNEYDMAWLSSVRDNPTARVVTVAYYSLVKLSDYNPTASSFAKTAEWISFNNLPDLGFDHKEIVESALESLKTRLKNYPVGFELLPEKFTLGQLQKLYESILGKSLDKRNFRRKILKMGFLIPLQEKQKKVSHKPAQLFQFDTNYSEHSLSSGF